MVVVQKILEKGCLLFFLIPGIGLLCAVYYLLLSVLKLTFTGKSVLSGIFCIALLIFIGLIIWKGLDIKKETDFLSRD